MMTRMMRRSQRQFVLLLWLYHYLPNATVLAQEMNEAASSLNSFSSPNHLYRTSSSSNLPPTLQNTSVPYPETRDTYVRYPNDAKDLLADEIAHYPSPLVVEVTSVITHWQAPLWDLLKGLVHRFRAQNQIIYVKAHHYVGNGMTEHGCRIEWVDEDTGAITERAVVSDACTNQCTNQGRYCAPEVPADLNQNTLPKLLVEETLRRLCIDDLYHASDLKHFEYLDNWKALQCYAADDMTDCAKQALAQVAHTDWASVQECMQLAGGLDSDVMNVRLQEQLDRQQGQYTLDNVPLLHIEGEPYKGPWTVPDMLRAVCTAYPTSQQLPTKVNPLACDFCSGCSDVRHCLWYLECDGKEFDTHTFRGNVPDAGSNSTSSSAALSNTNDHAEAIATQPPQQTTTTTPPVTTTTPPPPISETSPPTWFNNTDNVNPNTAAPNNNSDNDNNDDDEDFDTTGFFLGGILAGLVFGLLPALWFARREKRTRRQISAALATREQAFRDATMNGDASAYKDELDATTGTRPSPEELENMQDVMLDEIEFDGLPRTTGQRARTTTTTTTSQQQAQQQPQPQPNDDDGSHSSNNTDSNKKPPRLVFELHKIV